MYEYDAKLPSSVQWNGGVQMALPWATSLDVEYVGQHGYNIVQGVNLNAVDFGAAFLPQNQDLTLAASATPGATAVSTDLMRAIAGYGTITQQSDAAGGRTTRSRCRSSAGSGTACRSGFNDTMGLFRTSRAPAPRLQHNADGTVTYRSDQAQADALLGRPAAGAHHEGQLRLGSAGPQEQRSRR